MDILKEHLVSALITFIATFFSTLGAVLNATGTVEWTGAFWTGLLLVAVRAAVKEVFARTAPPSLGGRK